MTNEELWLTSQLARLLGVQLIDIVPRRGPGDDILLSADRNPNTNGARLLGVTTDPGANLQRLLTEIVEARSRPGRLGENPVEVRTSPQQISSLAGPCSRWTFWRTKRREDATVVPAVFGFAEKRGSMINGKGRLQTTQSRRSPTGRGARRLGNSARPDQALAGGNGHIFDRGCFPADERIRSAFAGLSLSKIGDLGVQVLPINQSPHLRPSPAHRQA